MLIKASKSSLFIIVDSNLWLTFVFLYRTEYFSFTSSVLLVAYTQYFLNNCKLYTKKSCWNFSPSSFQFIWTFFFFLLFYYTVLQMKCNTYAKIGNKSIMCCISMVSWRKGECAKMRFFRRAGQRFFTVLHCVIITSLWSYLKFQNATQHEKHASCFLWYHSFYKIFIHFDITVHKSFCHTPLNK